MSQIPQVMTSVSQQPCKSDHVGLSSQVRQVLEQAFPPEQVKHDVRRHTDGWEPVYVEAANVIQRLNDSFNGMWSFQVVSHQFVPPNNPTQIVVHGRLVVEVDILDPDKSNEARTEKMTKEQFGSCFIKVRNGVFVDLGSDLKAAATDALKKCATMLGIALTLYNRDESAVQGLARTGEQPTQGSFPALQTDPNAKAQAFQLKAVTDMFAKLGVGGDWPQRLGFLTVDAILVGHITQLLSGEHPFVRQLMQEQGRQPGLQATSA